MPNARSENYRLREAAIVATFLCVTVQSRAAESVVMSDGSTRCSTLTEQMAGKFPNASTRIVSAVFIPKGPIPTGGASSAMPLTAPGHCEVIGIAQPRTGTYQQQYAIRFHLRLPTQWNGRFFFQGGGGSNGVIGDALGSYSPAAAPALMQGFAVVSQDSGHDNHLNDDPSKGGTLVFGFDPQARANYGHASLPLVAHAAKALVKQFYGTPARYSYFVGCSKGGEEGLAFAERYPDEFDGIAASAPGMSLPRAAVEAAWDTQSLAMGAGKPVDRTTFSAAQLAGTFTPADLGLVRDAVLATCDTDDGLQDGIVGAFEQCTASRVRPQLLARQCPAEKTEGCLSVAQIDAITRLLGGAHDSHGRSLYSMWPWDAGIAGMGWRAWKLGTVDGRPPSLNVTLGGASLASVFTTPPTALSADPMHLLDFLLDFDFDRDAPRIYATNAQFPRSAWDDNSARSSDLRAFRARHGKLIMSHGVSDPVFSINDTLAWWHEVDQRSGGQAAGFVRVFPVPGMNHCGGGPATDQFDLLALSTSPVPL